MHQHKDAFEIRGNELIANVTSRQHLELQRALTIWEQGEPKQISIATNVLKMDLKQASAIDWSIRQFIDLDVQGSGTAIAVQLSRGEASNLMQEAQKHRRTMVMMAPRVTVFDGQSSAVNIGAQRPFVTSVKANKSGQVEPIVSTFEDGVKVRTTPITLGDSEVLEFTFSVELSSIDSVAYANIPISDPHSKVPHTTVQVPSVRKTTISAQVQMHSGESIVIAVPEVFQPENDHASDHTTLVMLTPNVLASDEAKQH